MTSKILLTNYPRIKQNVKFEEFGTNRILDLVVGYDININSQQITKQIANDLIIALLTYDKIYVEGSHINDIIQVWGSEYLKELLRLKIIQVIPDQNLNPALKKFDKKWEIGFFPYAQHTFFPQDLPKNIHSYTSEKWSHIENKFSQLGFTGIEANTMLYLIDENCINIDENEITKRINTETNLDLRNSALSSGLKLITSSKDELFEADFPKLLRLQELNKTGVLAASLDVNSLKTDAEINTLLALKSISHFSKKYNNGIDSLNKIQKEKGFPDLGELFINKIIGLDEILKLRQNFHGRIFRYWLENTEYNDKLIRQEIMNSIKNTLGNNVANSLRMITCNLIGIAGFIPGILASAFDSFILSKISQGWHPNFFLDNEVKKTIDLSIKHAEENDRKKLIKSTFKGIGRNDNCPCGSTKKFKRCHGKGL